MRTEIVIKKREDGSPILIPMGDMKPGDVGVVFISGDTVMRTLRLDTFEAMNLSTFRSGQEWCSLPKGEGLKVEIVDAVITVDITKRGK